MTASAGDLGLATPPPPARRGTALLRHPPGLVALGYVALLVTAVVAAPVLAPYDPTALDLDHVLSGPTAEHPLGTDALGRDVLSRLMYGGRISLLGVVQAAATVLLLGVPAGLAAGFLGGWFDHAVTVIADVVLAIPVVVTLLVVLAVFGSNQTAAMVALGALGAPGLARVVRGATLAVAGESWVAAARVAGLTDVQILVRHVLPRVAGPIIVQGSLFAGMALLAETGLGYLGLGAQPPIPTWGGMVAEASMVIERQTWLLVPSGAVIGLTIVAFGLLGDLVRDAAVIRGSHGSARAVRLSARPPRAPVMPQTPEPGHPGPNRADEPARPSPLLSVRGLTVQMSTAAGPSTVVEDGWLDIDRGEIVGLVGESGCGKSITGRAILGLLPKGGRMTAGSILFDGRDLAMDGPRALRRVRGAQIALISQQSGVSLDPCFTVGRQVREMLGGRAGDRTAARARVYELLRSVNLPDAESVARRYPHELSGGMAQRVAIAMALAKGPRLLIADEPTTALDATVQAEILDLLRGLSERDGMSILLITHDWGVVADICARSYVMYAGHVMEAAATEVLFERQRHPYTLGLLGSMVYGAEPMRRLRAIPGTVPEPRNWPDGCRFHPRCPLAIRECEIASVPVVQPEPGHYTRCLRHEAIPREGDHELVRGTA